MAIRRRYAADQPLKGARIAGCLHMSMFCSPVPNWSYQCLTNSLQLSRLPSSSRPWWLLVLRSPGPAATSSPPRTMLLLPLPLPVSLCKLSSCYVIQLKLTITASPGRVRPRRSTTGAWTSSSMPSKMARSSTLSSTTVVT